MVNIVNALLETVRLEMSAECTECGYRKTYPLSPAEESSRVAAADMAAHITLRHPEVALRVFGR